MNAATPAFNEREPEPQTLNAYRNYLIFIEQSIEDAACFHPRAGFSAVDEMRFSSPRQIRRAPCNTDLVKSAGLLALRAAGNGELAMELAAGERFDCILMDPRIPVMDGLTAARAIRKGGASPDLPIISMTGDRERCIGTGMNDHIARPIDPPKLYETLIRWIRPGVSPGARLPQCAPLPEDAWSRVWLDARTVEPNNNLLNLIAKARKPKYQGFLAKLFNAADEPFVLHKSEHAYLYMHGLIEPEMIAGPNGVSKRVCRFASPFIQRCLYDVLSDELIGTDAPILAIDLLDDLEDVFEGPDLDLPALLNRYKDYLARLKVAGVNPWKDQPRRKNFLP